MDDGFFSSEYILTKIVITVYEDGVADEIKKVAERVSYLRNVTISTRRPRFLEHNGEKINRDGRHMNINEMTSAEFLSTHGRRKQPY